MSAVLPAPRIGWRSEFTATADPRERPCAYCWGSRAIWQPGPLGLLPVACRRCGATGREPRRTVAA